jgi:hypothetical protein
MKYVFLGTINFILENIEHSLHFKIHVLRIETVSFVRQKLKFTKDMH